MNRNLGFKKKIVAVNTTLPGISLNWNICFPKLATSIEIYLYIHNNLLMMTDDADFDRWWLFKIIDFINRGLSSLFHGPYTRYENTTAITAFSFSRTPHQDLIKKTPRQSISTRFSYFYHFHNHSPRLQGSCLFLSVCKQQGSQWVRRLVLRSLVFLR